MIMFGEVIRFGIVGAAATAIQYAVYWLLVTAMPRWGGWWPSAALTIGYIISLLFNFFASTRFTFRVRPTARRGAGFLFSHLVNYTLQMITLNIFLMIGVKRQWAPLPMYCLCVPVNFLLVRYFLKKR